MKTFIRSFIAVAVFASAAGSANAAVIDFSTGGAGAGGTLTIGANVTGTGILIDTLTVTGTPLYPNAVFNVNGTGTCLDTLGGCGILTFDKNANTISLVGSIPSLGINSPITLLTGDLNGGAGVVVQMNDGQTGGVSVSGHDTKNPLLLTAVGLDAGTQFTLFGGVIGAATTITGPGVYITDSTDIHNNSGTGGGGSGQTLVPEPGSLLLFGTGLMGAATKLRRRFSKKA